MAIISFTKEEVTKFLGRKFSEQELIDNLNLLGLPVEEVREGEIFVDVTPNRPDLLSVEGIGRALASFMNVKIGLRTYDAKFSGVQLFVDKSVKKVRPYIVGAVVKNVEINDEFIKSIIQLQEKLHETFGRKRRKLAIGIHNFAALSPPFYYKAVGPNDIKFIPLDMHEELTPAEILKKHPKGMEYGSILKDAEKYPVILDSKNNVLSMPPIINGELTRLSKKTKELFLDLTGTDEYTVMDALRIISTALVDRGGQLFSIKVIDDKNFISPDLNVKETEVDVKEVNKLLGTNFSQKEMKQLLGRMGHDAVISKKMKIRTPCYRTDIMHWVDIAEDVAIAYDYNKLQPSLPNFFTIGMEKPIEILCSKVREVMIGLCFEEILAWYLTNEKTNFQKTCVLQTPYVKIKNPLTENFTMMRTWSIPSLLSTLSENKHVKMPIKVFEIGDVAVFENDKLREVRKLCCGIQGSQATFSEIRAVVESILFELDWKYEIKELVHASFIKGRAMELIRNGKRKGIFGEIHPQVLNNFGLEHPVAAFELEIS
jgi:phenylalanyl-tRNA synthetase beta chain